MQYTANTFIDFDGTLINENSSQMLIEHLFARASTKKQRGLVWLMSSRISWIITKPLGVAARLSGEKDTQLWLVLMFFRKELYVAGNEITSTVARSLHLNPRLNNEYHQPFIILSVGLEAIIDQFLLLHPELNCANAYGSKIDLSGQSWWPRLKNINHKLHYLSNANRPRYFTDYWHEADVFRASLGEAYRIFKLPPSVNTTDLYLLEESS